MIIWLVYLKTVHYREILNSDAEEFGGSGVINKKVLQTTDKGFHGKPYSIKNVYSPIWEFLY